MTKDELELVKKHMFDLPKDKLAATTCMLIALASEADHTRRTLWWCTAFVLCFIMLRDMLGGLP